MNIRHETVQDYAAIGDLNAQAFDGQPMVGYLVSMLRHYKHFDPELSIVAEIDGQIVGHVLFTPRVIRLLGQDMQTVNLSPIAVDPAHQGKGIGGAIIQAGHDAARAKGYALSVLVGHPTYYPRFGYVQHIYGSATVEVTASSLPQIDNSLTTRTPEAGDIPALVELWRHEESGVDFAVFPGDALLDWLSPNPHIKTTVYLRGDKIVGYTRAADPSKPHVFLAADPDTARLMAAMLAQGNASVALPLHPACASAAAFEKSQVRAWDAAMACPLAPSLFDEFLSQLQAGKRLPGRVIWPTAFDIAE